MSGILKVGGSELINDNGGSGALQWGSGVPTGTVLQVVQSGKSNTSTRTHIDFADIPGTDQSGSGSIFCVKITPKSISNKIMFFISIAMSGGSNNAGAKLRLMRDSQTLAIGDADSNRARATFAHFVHHNLDVRTHSMMIIDSPARNSELTYKPQFRSEGSSYTTYVNRGHSSPDANANGATLYSNLIVMEIAG